MNENIIEVLKEQHKILRKECGLILDLSFKKEQINSEEIFNNLKNFEKDLSSHLTLENDIFYVELIKKMKAKGLNTEKTEEFIYQMKEIEKIIYLFLEKFKDISSIEKDISLFHIEFVGISNILILRLESEESGVFTYWDLF